MQYSIVINQVGIVKAGLHKKTDFTDWAIIDYIIHWFFSKDAKKGRDEEEEYVWINYNHLLEQMPMLPAKDKPGLSERFKKLRQLGLIKSYQVKKSGSMYNALYVRPSDLAISVKYYEEKPEVKKEEVAQKKGVSIETQQGGVLPPDQQGVHGKPTGVFMESQHIYSNIINQNIKIKEEEEKNSSSLTDSLNLKKERTVLAEPPKKPVLSDEEWLNSLKSNKAYEGIDIERLQGKMIAWCELKGKKPTRARLLNWLNREEKPIKKRKEKDNEFHPIWWDAAVEEGENKCRPLWMDAAV